MDRLYFHFNQEKNRRRNRAFVKANPGFALPPPYMLYESYRLNYRAYYEDGLTTAKELVDLLQPFVDLTKASLLEWGCGPARVVRHLPGLLPGAAIFGTDYNPRTIAWCNANVEGVTFSNNGLQPPLPFPAQAMDAVYAISVFTHLAAENHFLWRNEIHRILKPGGVFLFTTQGGAFQEKLTTGEKLRFREGGIVVRGQVKEGHRSYSAFHPQPFVLSLLQGQFEVLRFMPGQKQDWGAEQDTWIVKKLSVSED